MWELEGACERYALVCFAERVAGLNLGVERDLESPLVLSESGDRVLKLVELLKAAKTDGRMMSIVTLAADCRDVWD
jgi:hypothetical protein